jgi:hypothetical protein
MANKTEAEIKAESLSDLSTAMEIVGQSNHPEKDRIIESLENIDEFCERWWET